MRNSILDIVKCKRCFQRVNREYSKAGYCLACYKEMGKLEGRVDPAIIASLKVILK